MCQFMLYLNEDETSNETYPYFIDIQNSLLSGLNTRLVIPLSSHNSLNNTDAKKLCPVITFDDKSFVLLTHQMTSVPKSILRTKIISLEDYRYEIIGAIDMILSGI